MHAIEGRPIFIVVTGRVSLLEDDDGIFGRDKKSELSLHELYDLLKYGIQKNIRKKVNDDTTGFVFEIPVQLTSMASKGFLLIGYGRNSIPVILVLMDLLHPTRCPEEVGGSIKFAINYLNKLIKEYLPEKYVKNININIVDAKFFDAPFSLDMVEYVPSR